MPRPARAGRGATARIPSCGAVTVEAALALLAMTVVLAGVVWASACSAPSSRSARRPAPRRGRQPRADSAAEVRAEAQRLVPDASVSLGSEGDHVLVQVRRVVRAPGLLARFGAVELEASAIAAAAPA